tara:strand:+ start:4345 stop:5055 length:711 start_codon:yes stop_codon:yes gene_type:complete
MTDTNPPSRVRSLIELGCVVAFALISKLILDQYIWKFSGPVSLALTLVLFSIWMQRRGETWSAIGLRPLPGLKAKLLILPQALLGVVAILATGVLTGLAGDALGLWSVAEQPAGVAERWGDVRGNLPVYLLWVTLSWVSGGFAEEMFFRGVLITWAARVFGGKGAALVLAVLFAGFVFGYGHFYYQGLRGWVSTGMIGVALGVLYLVYKRNLWPLIIAHGLVDTLVFTAHYADLDM